MLPQSRLLDRDDGACVLPDRQLIYGFVLQEVNLPFDNANDLHEVGGSIIPPTPTRRVPAPRRADPEHVLQPGYSYGNEFEFGLGLILDGLKTAMHG